MTDQRRVLRAPAARRGPRPALGRLLIAAPLLGWGLDVPAARAQSEPGASSQAARPGFAPAVILNPDRNEAEARLRSCQPAAVLNPPKPKVQVPSGHQFPPAAVLNASPSSKAPTAPETARPSVAASAPKPAVQPVVVPSRAKLGTRMVAAPAPNYSPDEVSAAPKPGQSALDRSVKPTSVQGVPAALTPPPADLQVAQAPDEAGPSVPDEAGPRVPDVMREIQGPDAPLAPYSDTAVPAVSVEPETPVIPRTATYPIDLNVALRLADVENPDIAGARARIMEALAIQTQARVLLVPSLNAGVDYHAHHGVLLRSSGHILNTNNQSLYIGGGTNTLAAETVHIPMVVINTPLTDAWFRPLVTHQRVIEAESHAVATTNSVLREVTLLYLDLLGAEARLEAMRISQAQTAEIARVVNNYAMAGEGRQADAHRAAVTNQLRLNEVQRIEGEVAVASARLARRLNLDPSVRLEAHLGPLTPINLVDPASDPETLTQIALQRRPELVSRAAEVAAVRYEFQQEVARPLLPTIMVGYSAGGYGGGSNLSLPNLGRFAGRSDFDVFAYWTVLNLGEGNMARWRRRRAQVGEAIGEQSIMGNQVREEVAASLATLKARSRQIEIARYQLSVSEQGFNEDFARARQNLGRPIEVLDNLERLVDARIRLINAMIQYNQAQFSLFVALGSPPPLPPATGEPVGPPPVTTPAHTPIPTEPIFQ